MNESTPELVRIAAQYDIAGDQVVSAIASPAELAAKQKYWKQEFLELIGGLPQEKTPLYAESKGISGYEGYTVEKILFQSAPGVYVTGLLYLPDSAQFKKPYPALLIVHGHSDFGKTFPQYSAMAIAAVKAGFGVFAPDPVSQGERFQCSGAYPWSDSAVEHASLGARSWLVGWNFARFRIHDGIRAVDFMESRPELDMSQLAVAGNSGGGTMSVYLQALDERIRNACPNSYVSSLREVIRERGVHDAEQFFFDQLPRGFNHAVLLAMGQPRVNMLAGARHQDYFPMEGTRSTFAVLKKLHGKLGFTNGLGMYSCDGEHGWAVSSRTAALTWLRHFIKGEKTPFDAQENGSFALDENLLRAIPDVEQIPPLPHECGRVTESGQVRDLPGFHSLYDIIRERAEELAAKRIPPHQRPAEQIRETVRRRAVIHPLNALPPEPEPHHHQFQWWYLNGTEGFMVEQHAALLAAEGKSLVGIRAEAILRNSLKKMADNGGKPVPLEAGGMMCIAAAHAYAAEPQLFSSVSLTNPPPSWLQMLQNPDPRKDSLAAAVWGALEEYDWTELVPADAFKK